MRKVAKGHRTVVKERNPAGETIAGSQGPTVPKAHIASYFELPEKSRTACWLMVDRVRWLIDQRGAPEGWQIEVVGDAVEHTIHIKLKFSVGSRPLVETH